VCRICRPPPLQSSSVASTCESRALPAHCCSWAITYFPFHQRDLRSDKPQEGQVLIGLSNAQYAERAFTALYAETFPNIFGDSRRSGARTTRAPCGAHTSCSRCRVTCDMRRVYRVPLAAASYRYSICMLIPRQCHNFKDPSVQLYGGSMFRASARVTVTRRLRVFCRATDTPSRPSPTPLTQRSALCPHPRAQVTRQSTCLGTLTGMRVLPSVTSRAPQVHGPLRRLLRATVPRQDVRRQQLRDSVSQARHACLGRSMRAARPAHEL
jgi:hypothetical protein